MHAFMNTLRPFLCGLVLASASSLAHAGLVLADWTFGEAAGTTLNNTVNTGAGLGGPGGAWNVAITGVGTDGTGALIMGNDGKGGSGTRSAYADFGPAFDQVTSGVLTMFVRIHGWDRAGPGASQAISLDFIEGNDFLGAGMRFASGDSGFVLDGRSDEYGDGGQLDGAVLTGFLPITLRLDLNLDLLSYALGYDAGAGHVGLGTAPIDSLTAGINSLRFGSEGDFGANPLALDRLWVEWEAAAAVPEPGVPALLLAGLAAFVALRRRA